jgi:predicted nucleotidyltransferase
MDERLPGTPIETAQDRGEGDGYFQQRHSNDERDWGVSPTKAIVQMICEDYPDVQAVYLFGSWGTEDEWPSSDVDIAMLLPPDKAKTLDLFALIGTQSKLETLLHKPVDLLNLRQVSTVFQKEVIMADRRVYTGDEYAAEEFEMLTISYYQKLNEERAEILDEFQRTGKAYNV